MDKEMIDDARARQEAVFAKHQHQGKQAPSAAANDPRAAEKDVSLVSKTDEKKIPRDAARNQRYHQYRLGKDF